MKIVKLEWKNIFSYGDDMTTIEFDDNGKLWQLTGKSGAGKSSLLAIPKLLLFGKTEGSDGRPVKVGDIANRINKKGLIRGTIKKGNDVFIIERTFSPQGLLIFKNGEDLERAGLKNMQSIIDTEVLDGLPYHIFSNVMTLSLNNFKSFISMTPADKRLIIDKIFSLEIINKVHELVKKDMSDLGNKINSFDRTMKFYDDTITSSKNELEKLKEKKSDDVKTKLDELQPKLKVVSDLYSQQSELYKTTNAEYTNLVNTENQLTTVINSKVMSIKQIEQQIALFNQDRCPTCGTPFNSAEFDNVRQSLNERLKSENEDMETQKKLRNDVTAKKNEYVTKLNAINENIAKITKKDNELKSEYKSIEAVAKSINECESIKAIIKNNEDSKAKLEKDIEKSNIDMKMLTIIEKAYSADGIKQSLMQQYIPFLNKEIAETLLAIGFPYSLEFDNAFNPHLRDLSMDIEPQSLSIGEHKKVDITVLCSILKMIKRKYPQINLVCLDETISSLDYESSAEIIKYLREISASMNLNIFVVSHTQLDETLFDEHLHVDKVDHYSILKKI